MHVENERINSSKYKSHFVIYLHSVTKIILLRKTKVLKMQIFQVNSIEILRNCKCVISADSDNTLDMKICGANFG